MFELQFDAFEEKQLLILLHNGILWVRENIEHCLIGQRMQCSNNRQTSDEFRNESKLHQILWLDIAEEFQLPTAVNTPAAPGAQAGGIDGASYLSDDPLGHLPERRASAEVLDERMMRLEKSIVSVLSILKKIVATPQNGVQANQHVDTPE